MAVTWSEAPDEVIELAEEIIAKHHEALQEARIGFLMRSEAPVRNGVVVLGQASVVSAKEQVHIPYDFLIWLAGDEWERLSLHQQRALIDHELSHCAWDSNKEKGSLRGHDVEEFAHIVERYGLWRPAVRQFARAVQVAMDLPRDEEGGVFKVDVEKVMDHVYEGLKAMEDETMTVERISPVGHRRNGA